MSEGSGCFARRLRGGLPAGTRTFSTGVSSNLLVQRQGVLVGRSLSDEEFPVKGKGHSDTVGLSCTNVGGCSTLKTK